MVLIVSQTQTHNTPKQGADPKLRPVVDARRNLPYLNHSLDLARMTVGPSALRTINFLSDVALTFIIITTQNSFVFFPNFISIDSTLSEMPQVCLLQFFLLYGPVALLTVSTERMDCSLVNRGLCEHMTSAGHDIHDCGSPSLFPEHIVARKFACIFYY